MRGTGLEERERERERKGEWNLEGGGRESS